MPYTTRERVRQTLARDPETSVEGTAASLDDDALDEQIRQADERINAKLAGVYEVPFEEPYPALVASISTALAAYYAYLTYREVRDLNSQFDPVYLRYKEAMDDLLALQQGKSRLPEIPGEDEGSDGRALDPVNTTSSPLFSECDFDMVRPYPWWP